MIEILCAGYIGINLACADQYGLPPMYFFNPRPVPAYIGLRQACEGKACEVVPSYINDYNEYWKKKEVELIKEVNTTVETLEETKK